MTLAEALALVDLEPGRTYRCRAGKFDVEVCVLDQKSSVVRASKVDSLQFMKPFTVEECDLVWGDLFEPSDEADLPDIPYVILEDKKSD
jgi:hypothetical protein